MRRTTGGLVALFFVVMAGNAAAQSAWQAGAIAPPASEDVPALEIGGTASPYIVLGWGPLGVRMTRNFNSLFAIEGSAERQTVGPIGPGYTLLSAGTRVSLRQGLSGGAVFVSLSGARVFGLDYDYTPIIAVGTQTPWLDRLAIRLDYQYLPRGGANYYFYDRSRLMVSVLVGI